MLNSVYLIGRAVATPELKNYVSANGNTFSVTSIRLAVDRPFRGPSGEEFTDFFSITCWELTAKSACDYVRKGDLIGVYGRLQSRISEMPVEVGNEKVIKKISNVDIIGERIMFLSVSGTKDTSMEKNEEYNQDLGNDEFDDIPESE